MSTHSNIEWTDASWQITSGCTKVSPGCKICYAETMANRLAAMAREDIDNGTDPKGKRSYLNVIDDNGNWNNRIELLPQNLEIPLRWKKPRRVFVNSMSDLFHKEVPFEFIDKVFAVMALCPQHTFQVLTKRPERMRFYLNGDVLTQRWLNAAWLMSQRTGELVPDDPHDRILLRNVWLGTSIENQKAADERIPHLLKCPAAVRFLSVEPLLGPVRLDRVEPGGGCDGLDCLSGGWHQGDGRIYERYSTAGGEHAHVDWVIVGGESGPHARPMHPDWARSIRDQCAAAGVPFFFKQWGEHRPKLAAIAGKPEPVTKGGNWGTLQSTGKWFPQTTPWNGRQDADSDDDAEVVMVRVGKSAAGRLLDGREYSEFPGITEGVPA